MPTAAQVEEAIARPTFHAHVRVLRALSLVLPLGVTLFGGVLGVLHVVRRGPPNPDDGLLLPLSLAIAVVSVFAWTASVLVPARAFSSERLLQARQGSPESALALLRSRHVVLLALREGPALMGLVVCTIAVTGGRLATSLWALANAIPAVAFVLQTLLGLPDRGRARAELLEALVLG